MSVNWTSQFIAAFLFAVMLGNVLAVSVHVFTWWLRRRKWPRLVMAIFGGMGLLFYLCGIAYLCFLFSDGFSFDIDGTSPPPTANWQNQAGFSFLRIGSIFFVVIGIIGALQMRQIPARRVVACLCYCFEITLALLLLLVVREFRLTAWFPQGYGLSLKNRLADVSAVVFVVSLFALAFFRPLFLIMLKYIRRHVESTSLDAEQIS
jgi:hypothetical protein